jgi:hypothetical protein
MHDLFISYTTPDRSWAQRLHDDLKFHFPTLSIFWDRESIPPGEKYRKVLDEALAESGHLVVLWSEAAKLSNEVLPEIATFDQLRKNPPPADITARRIFYIPLEGKHGPLEDEEKIQGFVDLRTLGTYTKAPNRDTSLLAQEPHAREWTRIVRQIGDTVRSQDKKQQVNLLIVAMNTSNLKHIDANVDVQFMQEPTLGELLGNLGLTLDELKQRYGAMAAGWRPFGTALTVSDFMEQVRRQINRDLELQNLHKYRFQWTGSPGFDFVDRAKSFTTEAELKGELAALTQVPCVIVVDPMSLFNTIVQNTFDYLLDYTQHEHWVFLSLYPTEMPPVVSTLYRSITGRGRKVLGGYFSPHIPSKGAFARCGVNVTDALEANRLIRGSLGQFYRASEKSPLASGG